MTWKTAGALVALALALQGCARRDAAAGAHPPAGPAARYVILFVGDGMQRAHEVAASRFLTGADAGLAFHDPAAFDWAGFAATWDATTYDAYASVASKPAYAEATFDPAVGYDVARGGALPYPLERTPDDAYFLTPIGGDLPATDSASAATALATGRKTDQGNVAWRRGDPEDGALPTLAERARDRRGAAIGVVSTVPFSHATPASFVAHARSRSDYAGIASQIVNVTRPEVVIGGGWPGATSPPGFTYVAPADHAALKEGRTAYTLVERARGEDGGAALLSAATAVAASGGKLFGLFGGPGGNFEPPVPATDGTGAVRRATAENPSLAQAVRAALTVLSADPDGFFVLVEQGDVDWANHAGDYPRMVGTIWDLDQAVREAIAFVDRPGDAVGWENTLLVVTADHANNYLRFGSAAPGKGALPSVDAAGVPTDPAQATLGARAPQGGYEHTNELVSVYAKGAAARALFQARAGTWYPAPGVLDNTQIHGALAEFLGVQ